MTIRGTVILGLAAGALTIGGIAVAHGLAHASQNPIVLQRFLLGYLDKKGRFIATAGRGATNVDRNALALFVFSGAVDAGPNTRATLPLTLAEQADLRAKIEADPDYDPTHDGYEPGEIPRRRSDQRDALYVATGSVSQVGIQVAANGEFAPGVFTKYIRPGGNRPLSNRILFNPRYVPATYNKPGEIDYNPEALQANTRHTVLIDGGPSPILAPEVLVTNTEGDPIGNVFSTSFTTTDRYVQDFSRPEFRTATPSDASTSVAFDADIELEFSEAMDISTFVLPLFQGDDQFTIAVRYTQEPLINTNGLAGRNVLGTVRIKPQTAGKVVQFRPLQGFGKGPYNIEVVVTNGVTDLSGNNIVRQFQFGFTTEFNDTAEDFGQIDESFNNTSKLETSAFTPSGDFQDAAWNGATAGKIPGSPATTAMRGFLTTAAIERTFDVAGPNSPNARYTPLTPVPPSGFAINVWYHSNISIQMLWPASEMGNRARAINGMWWVQGYHAGGGRIYPNFAAQMGHASDAVDTSGFGGLPYSQSNFGGTPTLIVPGTTYRTLTSLVSGDFVRFPDFLQSFHYNGVNGLILDFVHNGDPTGNATADNWERWRADGSYPIQCATYLIGANQGAANKWMFTTRFRYVTPGAEAQSQFYDLGRSNARTLPQQLVPTSQPSGTNIVFLWQGAREDSVNPSVPDNSSLTAWVSDIRQLASYRYIRFRVTLINNTDTRTPPSLDTLSIPFVYK